MDAAAISDQALREIITGSSAVELDFLAAKILITRLRTRVKFDPAPATLTQSVAELRNLLVRFKENAAVQSDLRRISGSPEPAARDEVLFSLDEVASMIAKGKTLMLAADHALLHKLPTGNWIGGTIPYFMGAQGGVFTRDRIFVTELPSDATSVSIKAYTEDTVHSVYRDAPENGLSIIIIPGASPLHYAFALNAPKYELFAMRPLIGWISGTDVESIGKVAPEVISGKNRLPQRNAAVVMHIGLPSSKRADINIVNIFHQGGGDSIAFEEDGFRAEDALINGTKRNFADYLAEKKIDTKLPLVANYSGAMVNTSFQAVDQVRRTVAFYAPVFQGIEYRVASPVSDYVTAFKSSLPRSASGRMAFSCNCILNYLYSDLQGKRTGSITGPITFGEIAYQLVNQTLAYATISG